MKKIFFFIIVAMIATACGTSEGETNKPEYETHIVSQDNQYSLELPKAMHKITLIGNDISVLYGNDELRVYAKVDYDSKEDISYTGLGDSINSYIKLLKYYGNIETSNFRAGKITRLTGTKYKTKFVDLEYTKPVDDQWIFAKAGIIETDNNLYTVFMWTPLKQRETYEKYFLRFLSSFKELNSNPVPSKLTNEEKKILKKYKDENREKIENAIN